MKRFVDLIALSEPVMTSSEYFARKASNGPRLKPLGKPCHDCAVECDFYSGYSDQLSQEPPALQVEASLRWHCHNHPDRACRGNINRLGIEAALA